MIHKSGVVISISGLDGAGKSTLINLLQEKMDSLSKPAKEIKARLGFTPRMEMLRSKFFPNRSIPSSGKSERSENQPFKAILKSEIYQIISILDLILTFIQIRIDKMRGKRLLVDRYYWDNWIIYLEKFGKPNIFILLLWKIIKFVAGNPTFSFMLTLPPEETYQRINARNLVEQHQSIETLRHRAKLYQSLDIKNLIMVDATKSREEIFAEVWSYIKNNIY